MGRQPIPIRQIAIYAGVSNATVDRGLHDRDEVCDGETLGPFTVATTQIELYAPP